MRICGPGIGGGGIGRGDDRDYFNGKVSGEIGEILRPEGLSYRMVGGG